MKKLLIGFSLILAILVVSNKDVQACTCRGSVQSCYYGYCQDVTGPPATCEPFCKQDLRYSQQELNYRVGCIKVECDCDNHTPKWCCIPPTGTPPPPTSPPDSTPTPTSTPASCQPQPGCSDCNGGPGSYPGYTYTCTPDNPPTCSSCYPNWPTDYSSLPDPSCCPTLTGTPTPTPTPGEPTVTPTPILPTRTPTPTPIPPTHTPTPTPIQPTVIIAFPLPLPQVFSQKAITDVQNWVCLQTTPCSIIECSGGDPRHRVRIATKTDAKLIPSKKTYIFECLETAQGYRCTTGNGTLDQSLTGTNYLSSLSSAYGYKFISLTNTQNTEINQSSLDQVIMTNGNGDLGPVEWESFTTTQVGRVMMAMQRVLVDNNTGHAGTQQLGTFNFDRNYNTTCIKIKWDPNGTVFDIGSLRPIEGVKVTLLHKNKANSFDPVKASDIFNGLENPQVTSNDGKYAFYVPDGTYKLKLEKEGYQPVFDVASISKKVSDAYPQLYDGGEIMTKGKLELRNLAMKKTTFSDEVLNFFQNIWTDITSQ